MSATAIYACSQAFPPLSDAARNEIGIAVSDTWSVLAAGWDEPPTRAMRRAHAGIGLPWRADDGGDPETKALVWGTAAHALDYDDVHMTSITHPSAVLVPAIEAVVSARPAAAGRRAEAFALGLAVNVALGEALGFAHYEQGWHATSTIGSLAAGAAVAHLLGLDRPAFLSALAIAAAQASGLQRNFGTMVKPLQAGLAAAAGVRAGLLAEAGIRGPEDILGGSNGFLGAFGGGASAMPALDIEGSAGTLSRKLFPCCYMAHRPVAAALELRRLIDAPVLDDPAFRVEAEVPPGCLKALTVKIPRTGLEAKFSGHYAVAYSLIHGAPGLKAFTDAAARDAAVAQLAERVDLRESGSEDPVATGIDRSEVVLCAMLAGKVLARTTAAAYPGSPARPITSEQLEAKMIDCLGGDTDAVRHVTDIAAAFANSRP